MPEEHGALKLKVPISGDYSPGQADVPRAFREFADSQAERFTAASGRLLVAQPSDVAKFVAMKGDGTIDAEGNFQLAPVTSPKLKPSVGAVYATADLALGAAYADIPGAELKITSAVPSTLLVTATFDLAALEVAGVAKGSIAVDGAAESTHVAELQCEADSAGNQPKNRATVSQTYALSLTAAAHTIKLRARREGGGTTYSARGTHTGFLWMLVAS